MYVPIYISLSDPTAVLLATIAAERQYINSGLCTTLNCSYQPNGLDTIDSLHIRIARAYLAVANQTNPTSFEKGDLSLLFLALSLTLSFSFSGHVTRSRYRGQIINCTLLNTPDCKYIVKILNIYIMLSCTHLYHTSFQYLSSPCNACIACYIRRLKYTLNTRPLFYSISRKPTFRISKIEGIAYIGI